MRFHYLPLAGTFVIDSTEMKHSVHNNTQKFLAVSGSLLNGIGRNRVKRNEHIATQKFPATVVEGDYIRKIVVLKKLAVDFKDFGIIAKDIGKRAYYASVSFRHFFNPSLNYPEIQRRHRHPIGEPLKFFVVQHPVVKHFRLQTSQLSVGRSVQNPQAVSER